MPQIKVFNKYTKGYLGTYISGSSPRGPQNRVYYKRPSGNIRSVAEDTAELRTA